MKQWQRRIALLERQANATTTTYDAILDTCKHMIREGTNGHKLTVSSISEQTNISRKTLYTYFHDKHAIIEHILYRDIMKPINDMHKLAMPMHMMMLWLYEYVESERTFYKNLPHYIETAQLSELLTAYMSTIVSAQLAQQHMSEAAHEYVVHFYASGYVMALLKWIKDDMPMTPKQIATLYEKGLTPAHSLI